MTTEIVLMGADEARRETEELRTILSDVKRDLDQVFERLKEDEAREIWKALNYRSMVGYMVGALGLSRSNAYRKLDQMRATLMLDQGEGVPRGTVERPSQREAARQTVPLKQQRKRGIPDKTSILNAITTALDNFEQKTEGYEDEEIRANLTNDEQRALERAYARCGDFMAHADRIFAAELRPADEWASA